MNYFDLRSGEQFANKSYLFYFLFESGKKKQERLN